jgi:predicted signal transduction protein with EAL and GGDEF domain
MAAPVSADVGLILIAQFICIVVSVRRELDHRAAQLASQRESHLTFVALHDPETELPNRRAMIEELSRRLGAQRIGEGRFVVAIAVGIERFSILRGAVGYANANEIVRSLCRRLRECSDATDIFHISTSILGVVLAAASEEEARRLSVEGLSQLNATTSLDGQEIDTSVRTGAAIAETGSVTAVTLLERATVALDQARLLRY